MAQIKTSLPGQYGRLVSLSGGMDYRYSADFAIKTRSGVFTQSGCLLFAAANEKTAVLDGDYSCSVYDNIKTDAVPADNENDKQYEPPEAAREYPELNIIGGCVAGIAAGTTVRGLCGSYPQITSVYDGSGGRVTSGKLKSGYSVQTDSGSFFVAVRGDLNGTASVNSADVKALSEYVISDKSLDGCFFVAADMNGDNAVDTRDLLLLARECG